MAEIRTYEEQLFIQAYQKEQDAHLRRKFLTNKKLLLNPSEEMVEEYIEYTCYSPQSDVALIWPTMEFENQYGYVDGIPEEQLREEEEKELLEEVEEDIEFSWSDPYFFKKTQQKVDYDFLMKWMKFLYPYSSRERDYYERKINDFLNSIDWKVFRGYVKEER